MKSIHNPPHGTEQTNEWRGRTGGGQKREILLQTMTLRGSGAAQHTGDPLLFTEIGDQMTILLAFTTPTALRQFTIDFPEKHRQW